MLSVRRIAEIIKGSGHPALPSGCSFYSQNGGKDNMVIVPYPGNTFPSIFYLRERKDSGICECFRAIRPADLLEDRSLACPEEIACSGVAG